MGILDTPGDSPGPNSRARAYGRGRNAPAAPVLCIAKLTGDKPTSSGGNTVIAWQTEDVDTDGLHTNTTQTGRMTIPPGLGGIWEFTAALSFAQNATGTREVSIQKNGGPYIARRNVPAVPAARGTVVDVTTGPIVAMPGDYFEVSAWHDAVDGAATPAPVSLNVSAANFSRFVGRRLGDRRGMGGAVLFDPDVKYKGFGNYQSQGAILGGPVGGVLLGDHVQLVDDPVLGPVRQVMRVTTTNSDDSLTYPRNQFQGPAAHVAGDDVYIPFSVYVPEDTDLFGSMTAGRSPVIHEVYGPPTNGYGPNVLRIRDNAFALEPVQVYSNGTPTGAFFAWSLPIAELRGKWVDFIHRVKLSADPAVGLHQLWVNTGDGSGYVLQTLNDPTTGAVAGTTLNLATLRAGVNDGGNNFSSLKLAYTDLSIGSATLYYVPQRVCTTLAEASATSSYS